MTAMWTKGFVTEKLLFENRFAVGALCADASGADVHRASCILENVELDFRYFLMKPRT